MAVTCKTSLLWGLWNSQLSPDVALVVGGCRRNTFSDPVWGPRSGLAASSCMERKVRQGTDACLGMSQVRGVLATVLRHSVLAILRVYCIMLQRFVEHVTSVRCYGCHALPCYRTKCCGMPFHPEALVPLPPCFCPMLKQGRSETSGPSMN